MNNKQKIIKKSFTRITSYNVCYTKLLRISRQDEEAARTAAREHMEGASRRLGSVDLKRFMAQNGYEKVDWEQKGSWPGTALCKRHDSFRAKKSLAVRASRYET